MPGNDFQQQGQAGHIMGEGADLVEGGGEGDEAEAGDSAIARFETGDAAHAGGLANGAAGVAAQAQRSFAGRDRCG